MTNGAKPQPQPQPQQQGRQRRALGDISNRAAPSTSASAWAKNDEGLPVEYLHASDPLPLASFDFSAGAHPQAVAADVAGTGRLPSARDHACLPPVCRRSCLRMCPCPRRGRPARLSRRGRCPVAVVHPRLHPRHLGARQHRSVAPSARDIYGLARRRRHLTPCRPVGMLGPGQSAGGSPPGAVRLLWCRGAALASGPWPAPCRAAACASPLSDLPCHEQAPPSPQQSPKDGPEGPAFLGEVSPELSRLQLATDDETDEDMELEDELD